MRCRPRRVRKRRGRSAPMGARIGALRLTSCAPYVPCRPSATACTQSRLESHATTERSRIFAGANAERKGEGVLDADARTAPGHARPPVSRSHGCRDQRGDAGEDRRHHAGAARPVHGGRRVPRWRLHGVRRHHRRRRHGDELGPRRAHHHHRVQDQLPGGGPGEHPHHGRVDAAAPRQDHPGMADHDPLGGRQALRGRHPDANGAAGGLTGPFPPTAAASGSLDQPAGRPLQCVVTPERPPGAATLMFDFDRVIERRGTHASKWDMMAKLSGIDAPDAIPMWVADMDFAAPPGVTAALRDEVERATHGYYANTGTWAQALAQWMARRHALKVDPDWVSPTPGIVSGLGLILQAVSEPGDEVVVFPPAYHAFRRIILANERRILDAQVEEAGRYVMDLAALRTRLTPRTKVVFFCTPHNPGGTVWSPQEIRALARFCAEHDLILVSDEIHCDLVFPGARHTPTLTAAPEVADRLV